MPPSPPQNPDASPRLAADDAFLVGEEADSDAGAEAAREGDALLADRSERDSIRLRRMSSDASGADASDGTGDGADELLDGYGAKGLKGLFANQYVSICAAFSALGGLLFGYDQGVVSVILVMPQFLQRFPEVAEDTPGSGFHKGLLTAMIELGALFGALNQGWIADKYSRKYSIVFAVSIFIVGSLMQTSAMGYVTLVLARFIGGIGIGMLSMVVPLYISEISPPEVRGTLLVLESLSIVTGVVIAFCISYACRFISSEWAWRFPFLLQLLPGIVLGLGVLSLPFSPRWLAVKGKNEAALTSLARLRQLPSNDKRVLHEWTDIRTEAEFFSRISAERHPHLQDGSLKSRFRLELASWLDCFREGCWRRTHVGMGIMFFQQFVGINALIYYSPTLFATMGLERETQLVMSGVLNAMQLVGVISSLWTMDRFGRRPLLLCGSVGMTFAHTFVAVLVARYHDDWAHHTGAGWLSVCLLLFYMLCFGASWSPVPWAVPAEIFPSSLRGKGVALSTASNWLNNFLIGLATPPLLQTTPAGTYLFFALFCLLSLGWVWVFVPETRGRSLEDMDAVFGSDGDNTEPIRRQRIRDEMHRHRSGTGDSRGGGRGGGATRRREHGQRGSAGADDEDRDREPERIAQAR